MASWVIFRTAVASPRGSRSPRALGRVLFAHISSPYLRSQTRSISRAPPDPWRRIWDQASLKHITYKRVEASCNNARRTGQSVGTRYTPVEYHECAEAFFKATQAGSSPGSTYLLDHPGIDAALIYETGCIVRTIQSVRTPLEYAMWASASGLGFHPATITLVGDLVDRNEFGKMPSMSKPETEFRQIVKQGKDANALYVEGLRLLRAQKTAQAAAMLERALSIGGPSFAYKTRCDHVLGHIALRQGNLQAAAGYLEKAYEADPSSGYLLGEVYSTLKPEEAGQAYFSAGFAGSTKAWGRLAEIELELARKTPDSQAKKQHELWAMEFQRLSNPEI